MKKFTTAALAALIAAGSMGVASAADAQSRHERNDRQEQRQDRRDDRRDDRSDRRDDRQEWRQDNRDDRREYRQEARNYDRWQRSERRYNAGRYSPPRGYQVRQWSYGQRLPSYYSQGYVVNDYNRYGLRAPPRGYHYVRSGNDVVLAAVAGGLITAVIAGLFN
ncbi:RcnB family protein [Brevundimonas sp.]|uniref:RcnB family protein n=1 Tax=Brevundimonas sp. TaxID=1871086 RepID=UPI003D11A50A